MAAGGTEDADVGLVTPEGEPGGCATASVTIKAKII